MPVARIKKISLDWKFLCTSALILVFTFLLVSTAKNKSLVYDEVIYPAVGAIYWKTGDLRWNNEHPPLQKYISALPLLLKGINIPAPLDPEKTDQWRAGYKFFFVANDNPKTLIFLSRLPTMLLTLLLIGIFFFWTYKKMGFAPALFGSTLLAFDPLVISNGSLALNDLFVTFFFFLAIIFFLESKNRGIPYAILCGLMAGLAITSKFSGILLLILFPAWTAVLALQKKRPIQKELFELGLILLVPFLTILIVYRLNFGDFIGALQTGTRIIESNSAGFLLGSIPGSGTWYYYPIALLIKTPIPLLIIWGISLTTLLKDKKRKNESLFVLAGASVVILAAMLSQNHFGLRYLLPAVPLMAYISADTVKGIFKRKTEGRIILGLVGWLIVETIVFHPHHMAYFNQLVGGPRNGHKWLSGSNQDWGQDLPALAKFLDSEGSPAIYMGYVGSNQPEAWGIEYQDVLSPSVISYFKTPYIHPVEVDQEYLVVSTHLLSSPNNKQIYGWLSERTPIAFIGYTLKVYDLTNDIDSLHRIANIYTMMGRHKMANRQFQRILHLDPNNNIAKNYIQSI